jgi:hypothetical protein
MDEKTRLSKKTRFGALREQNRSSSARRALELPRRFPPRRAVRAAKIKLIIASCIARRVAQTNS